VYFIRCEDGAIKIGTTTDIANRKRAFGYGWTHILAVIPGDRVLEHEMHVRYAEHLVRGREYFRPVPELIDHINEIRASMGITAIVPGP
jgi:hypothetical protein